MGAQVADVEAPQDGTLQLGPALATGLVQVCVVPEVVDGARETAVPVVQARRLRDGPPAVAVQFGVQREVYANRLPPVVGGGVPGPGPRDHEAGAGGQPAPEAVVDADVGGVAHPQQVGGEDEEAVSGIPAESFAHAGHGMNGTRLFFRGHRKAPSVGRRGWSPVHRATRRALRR